MSTPETTAAKDTPAVRLPAGETWRALYTHFRPHRGRVALGAFFALVGTVTALLQPLAAKRLVEQLGEDESITGVLIGLTALVVLGTAIEALGGYIMARSAESVVLAARRSLIGRLLRLRLPAMERTQPGDLMSRITSDTTLLRAVTTQAIVSAATGLVGLVATLVMLALMDLTLLGVTLGVLVTIGGAVAVIMPQISRATQRSQEAVAQISTRLERAFGAFRTLKASGAEERETKIIAAAAEEAWRQGVHAAKWESVAWSSVGLAVQVSFLAVLGIGGARVASGAIDVATLIAFLLFLFYLFEPVNKLVEAATQYQEGSAAIARIVEAERLETEDLETGEPGAGEPGAGDQDEVSACGVHG
uniref:ABC transporter ATP-binding protein n=1 Tax=Streptomyces clavuligerus TaxID=1901 RepID=UPI0018D1D809